MYCDQLPVFYYITLVNENYQHPEIPDNVAEGIVKGMYLLKKGGMHEQGNSNRPSVRLLGSGAILREVLAAAELLEEEFEVSAEVWSVTSFNELRREGLSTSRWNLLHPDEPPRESYVSSLLGESDSPVIAATDYIKAYADQIREFVPARYRVLGTDGFGRSDTREKLRNFFEVDRYFVVLAALYELAGAQQIAVTVVQDAMTRFEISEHKPDPGLC
jgi:pyruvate dehydrogenase E1 component